MKKGIYALTALGLAAGSACARSDVTIHGIADAGIARPDTSAGDAARPPDSGNPSGIRHRF